MTFLGSSVPECYDHDLVCFLDNCKSYHIALAVTKKLISLLSPRVSMGRLGYIYKGMVVYSK